MKLKLNRDKKYLLACSFGPDSMALFCLLLQEKYDFDVAIVNYHLRKESNSEVSGLENYANLYNIKLHILDVKTPITSNIEANCRQIRYQYFKSLFDEYGYDALLVAHQRDDIIETYLLQKNRQNLPKFYGIAEKSTILGMEVLRPLLSYSKKDLENICLDNNVPYAIDLTNLSNVFKRNKIRNQIVKNMSDIEKEKMLKEIESKNHELESIFQVIKHADLHDLRTLIYFDEITYLYAINEMVQSVDSSINISKVQGLEILKALGSDKSNIVIKIRKKIYLYKEYDRVHVSVDEQNSGFCYLIERPQEFDCPYFYLDFRKDASNRNVHLDDYPLTIRNVKKDDAFFIKDYKVKVRRAFIDWKMPISLRKKWPIILNKNNEIIYVPRYSNKFKKEDGINFFVKI